MDWNRLKLPDNPYYQDKCWTQYCGDALKVLPELPSDSIDLVATDPPYGISFMGKSWDKALPDKRIWAECFRVLKDGAFAFVMSIPRADCLSRMIIALEDAGFMVNFTPIFWAYASGFPKAQNIARVCDKKKTFDNIEVIRGFLREELKGVRREDLAKLCGVTERQVDHWLKADESQPQIPSLGKWLMLKDKFDIGGKLDRKINWTNLGEVIGEIESPITWNSGDRTRRKPTTPQAKALDGSYGGFQPKPAVEVIIVAMKPLSEKTFVDQALKNRKGITWLGDGMIPIDKEVDKSQIRTMNRGVRPSRDGWGLNDDESDKPQVVSPAGRFPANLLVSDDVLNDGKDRPSGSLKGTEYRDGKSQGICYGNLSYGYEFNPKSADSGSFSRYFDLDKWAQKTFPFLIVPKASRSEKNKSLDMIRQQVEGTDGINSYMGVESAGIRKLTTKNTHPTVKPLRLMSYLITLGSREGDVVLDPFSGSGTTPLACQLLGRKCIAMELKEKYCEIAAKRCSQSVMKLEC